MINWSIVLSVGVGVLIVTTIPYVIYGFLYAVVCAFDILSFIYAKFRQVVLGQELVIISTINSNETWKGWVDPDEIEHNVVDVVDSQSWKEPDYLLISGDHDE